MNRHVLVLLYLMLWLCITVADVLQRRTLSARVATFFAWLWIGILALGLLGPTAEQSPSIAPVLACCGALIFLIALFAYREPTNLSPRFAFLMMVGCAGSTLAMIAVVAATGSAIVDPGRHARAWVGLLFLDVTLGLPVLLSLADRLVKPGFIARLLQRRGQRLPAAPTAHHGSSLLPRATERFSTALSPDAIRQALTKLTVPLGASPPGAPPTYRGVIPSDGSFSLTRYIYQVNRYGRGRHNPVTMDVDLVPGSDGTQVVLHGRETMAYVISSLPFVMTVGIGLASTWSQLFTTGPAHERAVGALEAGCTIGFVIGLGCFLLIHHFGAAFLADDRRILATALDGNVIEERSGWIGASLRLLTMTAASLLAIFAVGGSLLMLLLGGIRHNHELVLVGLACVVVYGAMTWGLSRVARAYFHGRLKKDIARITGRAQ